MDKKTAKTILETTNEELIRTWEKLNFDEYRVLLKSRSKEEIAELVKRVARDVLDEKPTEFQMIDHKGNRYSRLEYLGEE